MVFDGFGAEEEGGGYFAGANSPDAHLVGVEPGRDFNFDEADIRSVEAGDLSPSGDPIEIETAIEVGNIFKLNTRYSEPLGATYLDRDGTDQVPVQQQFAQRIYARDAELQCQSPVPNDDLLDHDPAQLFAPRWPGGLDRIRQLEDSSPVGVERPEPVTVGPPCQGGAEARAAYIVIVPDPHDLAIVWRGHSAADSSPPWPTTYHGSRPNNSDGLTE